MGFESENPKGNQGPSQGAETISPEQWRELTTRADQYFQRNMDLLQSRGSSSQQFILRTLCQKLDPSSLRRAESRSDEDRARWKEWVREAMDHTDRYLALLEKFPEFREVENSRGPGYFPDVFQATSGTRDLIEEYERRLSEQ